jgi:hypothetical protein
MTAIRELIEAMEAGAWDALAHYGPEVWQHIEAVFGEGNSEPVFLAYDGSLDAARALHEAVLPGWAYTIDVEPTLATAQVWEPFNDEWDVAVEAKADTPARAWLLAILRALEARTTPTGAGRDE